MIYIKWFILLIINLVTNLLSLPLSPFVALFANEEGWLPRWLYYFQTQDNPIDGDEGFKTLYAPFIPVKNRYQRWRNRTAWLWRNKLYYFSYKVLSVRYDPSKDVLINSGDDAVGNGVVGVAGSGRSGLSVAKLYRNNKLIAFKYYYIRQYKNHPDKCIRILIGWKLAGYIDGKERVATFGFSPSPWMHFIGGNNDN